ncbi:MAG: hypothetical protein AABZ30_14100, partial [Myxococcota bacterium]
MRFVRLLASPALVVACSSNEQHASYGDPDYDDPTLGVGAKCTQDAKDAECRPGLACVDGACAPAGTTASCGGCVISAECGEGLACAPNLGACPAGCEDTCDLNAL